MKIITAFLDSIGLWWETRSKKSEMLPVSSYETNDHQKLALHRDFLRSLQTDEDERLKLIENKSSQLFSQTGLIFAILSLFIPLIIDKVELTGLRMLFLLVLFIACSFYLLTIHNVAKTLNIRKYNYQRLNAEDVITFAHEAPEVFSAEEIRGLLSSLRANSVLNNQKGTNLIRAYRSFWIANVVTAGLSVSLCISMILVDRKKEPINVRIENLTDAAMNPGTNPGNAEDANASRRMPESNTNPQ